MRITKEEAAKLAATLRVEAHEEVKAMAENVWRVEAGRLARAERKARRVRVLLRYSCRKTRRRK